MSNTVKEVDIPEYENVPRWLVLQGEIDLRLFILENMLKDSRLRTPLAQMIDEATGFDKQLTRDAQELISEIRWLKREYDKVPDLASEHLTERSDRKLAQGSKSNNKETSK